MSLQAEIHRLKMERDVLEKADVIGAVTGEYRLCDPLKLMNMAKSSHFYHEKQITGPTSIGSFSISAGNRPLTVLSSPSPVRLTGALS